MFTNFTNNAAVLPDPKFITLKARLATQEINTLKTIHEIELEKVTHDKHGDFFAEGNFFDLES